MESKKIGISLPAFRNFLPPSTFRYTNFNIPQKIPNFHPPPLPFGITEAKYQEPEEQENMEFIRPSQIDSMDNMLPREDVRINASTHFKLISISLLFVESITFYWILIQLHQTEWAAISPIHITGKSTRSHASFDG